MTNTFYRLILLLICASLCIASGPDTGDPIAPVESEDNWVYGKIEYLHDLRAPNEYFMLLRAHPGQPVPRITGGYATTDVYAVVRLRGVDIPRELQHAKDRNRPHDWLANEREKWDGSLRYVWNLTAPTRTFKVYNLKVVESSGDRVLEGDLEVWLGGQWLNLAYMLMNDGHARPVQQDGTEWDWGMKTVPLLNPNVPK